MSSEEIIDPTVQHNASVRRVLLHMVLPFVLIILTVGAIAWVGISSYRTTSQGVSVLTRELMEATQQYIGQEVGDYIAPSAAGNLIAGGMIEHAPPQVSDKVFYSYGSVMLQKIPQLQSFYLADDQGNFTLITRSPDKDVLDHVRLVVGANGQKILHHVLYNTAGQMVRQYDAPAGEYDPRTRPWYKNTDKKDGIQWTQPYLFPSDKQFVMTSSLRFRRDDGHEMVFATNISLNELSAFLDRIKIGKSGSAMIVDASGKVIAGHNLMQHAEAAGWDPNKMVLDPKSYPVFALGYDHYRVRGFGPKHVDWDSKTYITMASALPRYSQGWILLIAAPENDFGSFAHQSSRQSLEFAAIVTVFSLLLGGLYIRQLRRTEAGNRRLTAQKSQLAQESGALQQVALAPSLFDPAAEALVITEQLAQVTGARRASLWRFLHDGTAMVCDDTYDRAQNTHSGGFEMGREELGKFFEAIEEGTPFAVDNAATDERTTRFERLVMREAGTHALAVYPVHGPHGALGMLALEEPAMLPHLLYFVELMASIAGTRFAAQSLLEAQQTPELENRSASSVAVLGTPKSDNLLMRADEMAAVTGASIYPAVAVLVVSFSDPVVEGSKETATLIDLINRLATQVQTVAQDEHLFAVEVAGHRMICMAGCTTEPDPTALFRLANAALKMRETFMGALAAADLEPVFTMGMDFGPAFGGAVGQSPTVFNLWGQTVSLAELMAESAIDPGTIQVTERVYASLRDRYLFRSRGSFFVPHLGLGRAYTLAARR